MKSQIHNSFVVISSSQYKRNNLPSVSTCTVPGTVIGSVTYGMYVRNRYGTVLLYYNFLQYHQSSLTCDNMLID